MPISRCLTQRRSFYQCCVCLFSPRIAFDTGVLIRASNSCGVRFKGARMRRRMTETRATVKEVRGSCVGLISLMPLRSSSVTFTSPETKGDAESSMKEREGSAKWLLKLLRCKPAFPPPHPHPPALHLLSATYSVVFLKPRKKNLIFQRDKGRIKEELAPAKQQLHLQTRGHYNEAAEALPRQHTGRWRGNMVTHWQRRQEGGGRVGGNKERKREMEVVIQGVFTCSSCQCLPGKAPWSRHRSAVSVSQLISIVGHLYYTWSMEERVFPFPV